jgi:4-amino-4-deoxy-L-arabinose transferase-like glycosyltransferase
VLVFKLLGMGFIQVKLLSLLAGVASVLVIYLLVKEDAGPLAGLLAGLALATSFPLTMYSRLGLVESVQILFLLLTGLCYVRGLKRPRQMVLAGLLGASTILLVKVSAAFIAPALAAAVAWELFTARRDRAAARVLLRGIGWGLAGIGIALCIWLVIVFLPHRADYFQYVLRHSLESPAGHPEGPVAYLLNTFTVGVKSRLIPRLSWVALLGFLTLPMLAIGRRPALRYLGMWFVLALLMLGYMNYRPDRYELVLLPALIAGFAVTLARLIETGTLVPRLNPTLPKAGLYALWLWILATQLTYYTNGFWGALRPRDKAGLRARQGRGGRPARLRRRPRCPEWTQHPHARRARGCCTGVPVARGQARPCPVLAMVHNPHPRHGRIRNRPGPGAAGGRRTDRQLGPGPAHRVKAARRTNDRLGEFGRPGGEIRGDTSGFC